MTDPPDVRQLILDLWHQPTDRDKQVHVGASNISNMCSRCVLDGLARDAGEGGAHTYWLGAAIGTAIHERLEGLATRYRPDWLTEQRLILGQLEGYGTIKSTTDLYLPEQHTAVDYKTTSHEKLVHIKEALTTPEGTWETTILAENRLKVNGYRNQVNLYGKGLVLMGKVVDWVSLVFICRDGKTDKDIWAHTEPYNPELADAVWARMEKMWAWLKEGHLPNEKDHHPNCYYA